MNESHFPRLLNEAEKNNPYLLLEKFFTTYPLPELQKIMQEDLVSKQTGELNTEAIQLFYKNLSHLFEATYLLKLRYDACKTMNWRSKEASPDKS